MLALPFSAVAGGSSATLITGHRQVPASAFPNHRHILLPCPPTAHLATDDPPKIIRIRPRPSVSIPTFPSRLFSALPLSILDPGST